MIPKEMMSGSPLNDPTFIDRSLSESIGKIFDGRIRAYVLYKMNARSGVVSIPQLFTAQDQSRVPSGAEIIDEYKEGDKVGEEITRGNSRYQAYCTEDMSKKEGTWNGMPIYYRKVS